MPLWTIGVGSLAPPSFIAHTHAMRSRPTLSGVICVSGLWLHAW